MRDDITLGGPVGAEGCGKLMVVFECRSALSSFEAMVPGTRDCSQMTVVKLTLGAWVDVHGSSPW
jgi:hypothetical protein